AGLGVEREEVAFVRSAEDQAAGRGHDAGPRWRRQREVPDLLTRLHIERADRAPRFFVETLLGSACVVRAWAVLDRGLVVNGTHFAYRYVKKAGRRAVRGARPVRRALQTRIDERAFLRRIHSGNKDWPALGVQPLRPGLFGVLRAKQEVAGFSIERVVERVAICHD